MRYSKFLFVDTHFPPDYHYGGVVESGSNLFKHLNRIDDFFVSTVSNTPDRVRKYIEGKGRCYRSSFFHEFGFSFDAILGLWKDVRNCRAVFINGIVTFPVTLAAFYAVILRKPFIVATRGGLEPWRLKYKRWKKSFYIRTIVFALMKRARYVMATSKKEEANINALGFSNTLYVPNGIDPDKFEVLPDRFSYDAKYKDKFIFLFFSRIDKEKGIDLLIKAYKKFNKIYHENKHVLLLVGPDNHGYLKSKELNCELENIEYIPGVYGDGKFKLIRQADVLVLPSYNENFGNVIAEALISEVPVVTTTGTPWEEIEQIRCGYYVKPEVESLLAAMINIYCKEKSELHEMGRRGRAYILSNFSWERSALVIYKCINSLLDSKETLHKL